MALSMEAQFRPFRRAVVTNDVGRFGGMPGRRERQRKSLRFGWSRTFPGSGHQHQWATKYRRRMKDLRRRAFCYAAKPPGPVCPLQRNPSALAMAELQ